MSRIEVIRGFPFPKPPFYKGENVEGTLDYLPKDGDIIIASYPKTGTTWMQYIVLQITSKGNTFPSFNDVLITVAPSMAMVGSDAIDSLKGLRTYKHHYPYNMVKKNPKSKVIYMYRNPEDVLVSYFRFKEDVYENKLVFGEYFGEFLSGHIEFGSYFEHVLTYLNHKNDDNLLLVSYEKLYSDPKKEILRVAKFLGEEYSQSLSTDESLLNKIIKNTSFDHMKKNLKLELPHYNPERSSESSLNTVNFFRKGVVGDGKNYLSTEQVRRLRDKVAEVMKGTEVLKEWIID